MLVRRKGGGETSKKFGESSSGCKSHPTKAEPGRSVVSLAAFRVTGWLMRRHASVRAARLQPRNDLFSGCRGFHRARRQQYRFPVDGRGEGASGGVFGRGAYEEDGLINWEIPFTPWDVAGRTESLEQTISSGDAGASDCEIRQRTNTRPQGRPKARGTGAEAEGEWEVGGLNMSDDTGELGGARTRSSKGSPCCYEP
jgi:hypothetical protein